MKLSRFRSLFAPVPVEASNADEKGKLATAQPCTRKFFTVYCRLSDRTSRSWAENKSLKRNQERLGKLLLRAICFTKCLCVNIVGLFHNGVSRSNAIFFDFLC